MAILDAHIGTHELEELEVEDDQVPYPDLHLAEDRLDSVPEEYGISSAELFEVAKEDVPHLVPRSLVNLCNQMRPDDEYGDLDELAESFIAIGQQSPVRICRWSRAEVDIYASINNALYKDKKPIDTDSFTFLEDGTCLVLIYGHRRFHAGARARQMLEAQISDLMKEGASTDDSEVQELNEKYAAFNSVKAKLSDSMSVSDALTEQAAENIYHQPPAHAFAKALNEVYLLGKEAGQWENVAVFSRRSGVGLERARNAVRYCKLPSVIIDQVESGKLSYAIATELARLIRHIEEHRRSFAEMNGLPPPEQEYLDEVIDSELKQVAEEMLVSHRSARAAHKFISKHINLHYKQLEFSFDPEELRRQKERESYRAELRRHLRTASGQLDVVEVTLAFAESIPDDIVAVLGQTGMQTLFNRLKDLADRLADKSGLKDETRRAAAVTALALQQLILTEEIGQELSILNGSTNGAASAASNADFGMFDRET